MLFSSCSTGFRYQVLISTKLSGHLVHLYRTPRFNTMDSEAMFIGHINVGQGPCPGQETLGAPLFPLLRARFLIATESGG